MTDMIKTFLKYVLCALGLTFLLINLVYSQESIISGVIRDESGEPLIRANVIVDISNGMATTTDETGFYQLKLNPGEFTVSATDFFFCGCDFFIHQR